MNLIAVPTTVSTNDDLRALALTGAAEGLWLRADVQTGGRGRQGRAWISPPGNLHASTLVRLHRDDPPPATLALVAAVALHETATPFLGHPSPLRGGAGEGVRSQGERPARSAAHLNRPAGTFPYKGGREDQAELTLKWPNDLMAGSPQGTWAKLAGILLERAGDAVVIGFGVNLAHHPEALDRPTTSLAALTGAAPDPATFLAVLAETFARWLNRWRTGGIAPVRTAWLAAAHPRGTALATPEGEGLFDGLDEDGALRLRLADGSLRAIHAGDVFLI